MFFSLSISWGGLFMFGSYNKFKHKVHITATVISSLDFVTSIIAGVLVFSILGHQSHVSGIEIDDLVEGGQGLAFIAYPDALTQLPVPQLWTVMFFFMLFLLGIDSEFALLETVLTCIYDGVSTSSKHRGIYSSVFKFYLTFSIKKLYSDPQTEELQAGDNKSPVCELLRHQSPLCL